MIYFSMYKRRICILQLHLIYFWRIIGNLPNVIGINLFLTFEISFQNLFLKNYFIIPRLNSDKLIRNFCNFSSVFIFGEFLENFRM